MAAAHKTEAGRSPVTILERAGATIIERYLRFQVAVNPEFKVGEMSFDNNAAICRLLYTGTFATVHGCVMGRPWHGGRYAMITPRLRLTTGEKNKREGGIRTPARYRARHRRCSAGPILVRADNKSCFEWTRPPSRLFLSHPPFSGSRRMEAPCLFVFLMIGSSELGALFLYCMWHLWQFRVCRLIFEWQYCIM